MIPPYAWLIAASAAILFALGALHLLYTFRGSKLAPRDIALVAAMKETHPRLTRETTLWKCWIGFNASHGVGAMLFGLVFGYLALAHAGMLSQSPFLLCTGMVALMAYTTLGRCYWFSIPYRGLLLATLLFAAALALIWI